MRLNAKTIASLKANGERDTFYWDSDPRGFGLRITKAGVKSFVFQSRVNGKARRITIGRFPEEINADAARVEAHRLKANPATAPASKSPTVRDLIAHYQRLRSPTKASALNEDRMLNRFILSASLADKEVNAVTKGDVTDLFLSLEETPFQANRVLGLLRSIFNFALDHEDAYPGFLKNPAARIKRNREARYDHFLTAEEVARILDVLATYSDRRYAYAIRLLLLTGSRPGEVLGSRWEHFDLENGAWNKRVPKVQKIEAMPLSGPALNLLVEMKADAGNPSDGWLFPLSFDNKRHLKSLETRQWRIIINRANVATDSRGRLPRPYALRHTTASWLVSAGQSLEQIGSMLSHTNAATTKRYSDVMLQAKRETMDLMGRLVTALETGTADATIEATLPAPK